VNEESDCFRLQEKRDSNPYVIGLGLLETNILHSIRSRIKKSVLHVPRIKQDEERMRRKRMRMRWERM
jgi:hypothetical protein